jgi:hypothetical protein
MEELTIVMEMQNVVESLKRNDELKRKTDLVWEIDSNIIYEHDRILEIITKEKVNYYQKGKEKRDACVLNKLMEDNTKVLPENLSRIINIEWEERVEDNKLKELRREVDCKTTEQEITDLMEKREKYKAYKSGAVRFLLKYDYFQYMNMNDNEKIRDHDILTEKAYYEYLDGLWKRINVLGQSIVRDRLDAKSEYNYDRYKNINHEYEKYIGGSGGVLIFQDASDFTVRMKRFRGFIKQLYFLSVHIKDTYLLMNKIMNDYTLSCVGGSFYNRYQKILNNHFIRQGETISVLPTSSFEYFRSCFYSINYKNEIITPFNRMRVYLATCFEINKLYNDRLIFTYKQVNGEIMGMNYMRMIFGSVVEVEIPIAKVYNYMDEAEEDDAPLINVDIN